MLEPFKITIPGITCRLILMKLVLSNFTHIQLNTIDLFFRLFGFLL
jgi:hypothetical protein